MKLTSKEIKVLKVITTNDCGVFLQEIKEYTDFNDQVIGGVISSLEDKLLVNVVRGQAENGKVLYQHRCENEELVNLGVK